MTTSILEKTEDFVISFASLYFARETWRSSAMTRNITYKKHSTPYITSASLVDHALFEHERYSSQLAMQSVSSWFHLSYNL